ncbi:uncharacterized protein A1O5_04349 [Cladophialophora psammophila CBS 110553]|uniref:AMP-dependent synthetase/ligase domain-containing protein n=1 Tax=Cladophialophora psammophila CBS 110553 TaxID=1182543 RepID=W9WVA9_9EURO|nr:uncharacterized protein A1O5_04349 [Cladophialophora psammophila CBS 110553]EXJ71848.1 hypothetical protein A1O5_04349 [Cladophialophora psammophila CBS 110553]
MTVDTKETDQTPRWRLLPQIIDDLARDVPAQIITSIPKTDEVEDGFVDFLDKTLGKGKNFETLTYVGPSDLRYPILALAANKAGYKMFWTSPRNSLEAHCQLVEASQSTIFLTLAYVAPSIHAIIDKMKMRQIVIPELADWLESKQKPVYYPFTRTYEESYLDPCMIIHTSGSTPTQFVFLSRLDASADLFVQEFPNP